MIIYKCKTFSKKLPDINSLVLLEILNMINNFMNNNSCEYCLIEKKSSKLTNLGCVHILCFQCINYLIKLNHLECPFCTKPFEDEFLSTNINKIFKEPIHIPNSISHMIPSEVQDLQMQTAKADKTLNLILPIIIKKKNDLENLHKNIKTTFEFNLFVKFKKSIKQNENLNISKMLEIIKKYKLYQLVESKINFQSLKNINDVISEYSNILSDIVFRREKKNAKSNEYSWLGDSISIFCFNDFILRDTITIDSEYPIILKSIGIGLSPCSSSKLKLVRLQICDTSGSFSEFYNLNYSQNSSSQMIYHFDFPNEVLLESGVEYIFSYEVQGFYVYTICQSISMKHGNYTITTAGSSMTFYLSFIKIC